MNDHTPDYDMIVAALRRNKLLSLESALERCIEEEAESLLAIVPAQGGPGRRTSKAVQSARVDARRSYGSEIYNELREPSDLTFARVLNTRRAANAWAIAGLMREYGLRATTERTIVGGVQ